jgi:hypothetical protein
MQQEDGLVSMGYGPSSEDVQASGSSRALPVEVLAAEGKQEAAASGAHEMLTGAAAAGQGSARADVSPHVPEGSTAPLNDADPGGASQPSAATTPNIYDREGEFLFLLAFRTCSFRLAPDFCMRTLGRICNTCDNAAIEQHVFAKVFAGHCHWAAQLHILQPKLRVA